jgi:hypothetical protein
MGEGFERNLFCGDDWKAFGKVVAALITKHTERPHILAR